MMSYRPGSGCCDVHAGARYFVENILFYHLISPPSDHGKVVPLYLSLSLCCFCCAVILVSIPVTDKMMEMYGRFEVISVLKRRAFSVVISRRMSFSAYRNI